MAERGHSLGQLVYALSSGSQQLLATTDVRVLPALFVKHPNWQVNVDQDLAIAMEISEFPSARSTTKPFVTGNTFARSECWYDPQRCESSYVFIPVVA
jgi:hypothetical protein